MNARPKIVCLSLVGLCAGAFGQDFNGNSVRDAIDIRSGSSSDCDHNGVPDEADVGRPNFHAAVEHHSDLATVSGVSSVAFLDADHDGDMDLMVASASGPSDSNLTLWRNDAGPGLVFANRMTVAGAGCYTLRVGDLNTDGWTDVVASDAGFAQCVVMLATGPGTFATPTKLAASSRGTGLAVADLDHDGDLDVAQSGFANDMVDVWKNNGNGTFGPRQSFAVDHQPVALAAGDVTGDGLVDLVSANSYISWPGTGTATVLKNLGGATFANHATLTVAGHPETSTNAEPKDVALADIDADSDLDLLVSSKDSNSIRVFTNNGTGTLTNTQTVGPLPVISSNADRVLCVNLDADPDLELAWCDSAAMVVHVYDNNAGAFVHEQSYAAGSMGPIGVAAGDMNGDSLPDLATANTSSNAFSTLMNRGGLNFDAAIHVRRPDAEFYPVLADVTGDALPDLCSYTTFNQPSTFTYYANLGGERFGPAVKVPLSGAGTMLLRDLNHDGHLDLLSIGGHAFVKYSNGDGTFGPEIVSDVYVLNTAHTADVNGDGNLDLLWPYSTISSQPSWIRISLGDSTGHFAPFYEVDTPKFLGSAWSGDLSGDGLPELFVGLGSGSFGSQDEEKFIVYPNLGGGNYGPYEVYASDLVPNFAGSVGGFAWVDIDGDGDDDLLVQSTYVWLFRNTNHALEPAVNVGGLANYTFDRFGPAILDVDADGDLDFFGLANISGITSPAFFLNAGTGTFGGPTTGPRMALMRYRNSFDAFSIADADLNGYPDLLVKPEGFADWYLHLSGPPEGADCNSNSTLDSCDIASGTSPDANANGIPDECETPCYADCEGDGDLDTFDYLCFLNEFAGATSYADCEGDGDWDVFDFLCFQGQFAGGC